MTGHRTLLLVVVGARRRQTAGSTGFCRDSCALAAEIVTQRSRGRNAPAALNPDRLHGSLLLLLILRRPRHSCWLIASVVLHRHMLPVGAPCGHEAILIPLLLVRPSLCWLLLAPEVITALLQLLLLLAADELVPLLLLGIGVLLISRQLHLAELVELSCAFLAMLPVAPCFCCAACTVV